VSLEPSEPELLRNVIASYLSDVHTSIPGRIVKYDAPSQTADVEIVVQRAEVAESGAVVHENYPVIPNVPIGWPSGGGYSFQFPLSPGDGVWLVFSEASIANWRETGDVSPPGDLERHDISYPIALPCARHRAQSLVSTTTARLTVPTGGSLHVTTVGSPGFALARDDKLQTELNRIKSDITTLKDAIVAGLTAVGVGAAANGTTGATQFSTDAADVPSNVGSTASSTLTAQ
jgi:hypothetical protein